MLRLTRPLVLLRVLIACALLGVSMAAVAARPAAAVVCIQARKTAAGKAVGAVQTARRHVLHLPQARAGAPSLLVAHVRPPRPALRVRPAPVPLYLRHRSLLC